MNKRFNKKTLIGICISIVSIFILFFAVKYYIESGSEFREKQAEDYYYKGLKYETENPNKAIEWTEKAIKIRPDYAEAHNYLAILYDRKGEQDKALKQLEIAVRINPAYMDAYNNLAILSQKMNHTVNAQEYSQIFREKFRLKNSLLKQSQNFYINNQVSVAIKTLKQTITISPEDATLYYDLAIAYIKSGFLDDAGKELKKAIKIAESKGQKDYVDQFNNVLSNLTSEGLVLEFILGENSTPLQTSTPASEKTAPPEITPAAASTVSPAALPTGDSDPQIAAVDTMTLFYQFLAKKDFASAYSLLSDSWKRQLPMEDFSNGFSSLTNIKVSSVRILETTDTSIKIKVYFTASKKENNQSNLEGFQGIYILLWQEQGWRIDEGTIEKINFEGK